MVATIVWAALVAGVTAFLAIAAYLVLGVRSGPIVPLDPAVAPLLLGASAAVSLVTVAVSWLWAVRMRVVAPRGDASRPARAAPYPPGPEADAVTRLVVAGALCEGGALLALVAFLATADAVALAPFAVSYLALLAHFPGDRHWAQLVGTPQGAGAGSNRMIRG
jgi:hypothetical protein